MKPKITLFVLSLLFVSTFTFAQKTIDASDIMNDIKNGKSITYKDVTIVGDLDFTFMDQALEKLPKKKKSSWFNWGSSNSSNEIKKQIDVKVSFVNCTFKNDVLAYIPHEDSGYTFTANFEQDVIFKGCTFERKAMFKYSHFENDSDFSGAIFEDDNTFKYAVFNKNINFSNAVFKEEATFKYSKFNNTVSFASALFKDTATFKYTRFKDGVSFKNTVFEEDLNIKYLNVSGPFDITNMKVAYNIDSKYTKINGKDFNKYLLTKE